MFGAPIPSGAKSASTEGGKATKVFFLNNPAQAPVGSSGAGGAANTEVDKSSANAPTIASLIVFNSMYPVVV
jgi:hypothetical protein